MHFYSFVVFCFPFQHKFVNWILLIKVNCKSLNFWAVWLFCKLISPMEPWYLNYLLLIQLYFSPPISLLKYNLLHIMEAFTLFSLIYLIHQLFPWFIFQNIHNLSLNKWFKTLSWNLMKQFVFMVSWDFHCLGHP